MIMKKFITCMISHSYINLPLFFVVLTYHYFLLCCDLSTYNNGIYVDINAGWKSCERIVLV